MPLLGEYSIYVYYPAGGIKGGGHGNSMSNNVVGSGGVKAGGYAQYSPRRYAPTGGVKGGGAASTSKVKNKGNYVGSGGIVGSGPPNVYIPPGVNIYDFNRYWTLSVDKIQDHYTQLYKESPATKTANGGTLRFMPKNGVSEWDIAPYIWRTDATSSLSSNTTFTIAARVALTPEMATYYGISQGYVIVDLEGSLYPGGVSDENNIFRVNLQRSYYNADGWYVYVRGDTISGVFTWYNATGFSLYVDGEGYDPRRIVVQIDTTQATASNRVKVFLDGVQLTAHASASYPAQNFQCITASGYDFDYVHKSIGAMSYVWDWGRSVAWRLKDIYYLDGVIASDSDLYSTSYSGSYGGLGFHVGPDPSSVYPQVLDSSGNGLHFEDYAYTGTGSAGDVAPTKVVPEYIYTSRISLTTFTLFLDLHLDAPNDYSSLYIMTIYNDEGGYIGEFLVDILAGGEINIYNYDETFSYPINVYSAATLPIDSTRATVCVQVDTTQATESDRVKIFIDGVEDTGATGDYPTQNYEVFGNSIDGNRPIFYVLGGVPEFDYLNWGYSTIEEKLYAAYFVDGSVVSPSSFNSSYEGPYGSGGFKLLFTDPSSPGIDYSGNDLHFSNYFNNVLPSPASGFIYDEGFGVQFELASAAYAITAGVQFRLYSGETVTPSIQFEITVDPSTFTVPFKLIGSGEAVSESVQFALYNIDAIVNPPTGTNSVKWAWYCLLNSTDVSSKLIDVISIEFEEDASGIASFTYAPDAGSIDPLVFVGKPVELHWRAYDSSGTLLFTKRRFYGWVADVEWNPDQRVINMTADTQMPAYFNALDKDLIKSKIGGLWSNQVWADEDDKSGWSYAQEVLSTTENCIWHDANRILQVTPLIANRSDPGDIRSAIVPHFTFTDDERFHETLSLEYAQRSEMLNTINISMAFEYQRRRHREITFRWDDINPYDPCAFLTNNYQLCQRTMVESAAGSGTWKAISPIKWTDVWAAGGYECGLRNYIVWNIGTVEGFVNGEPVTVDPATGEETVNEGFGYEYALDASHLCIGASWRAAARWVPDVTENYEIVVKAQDSITAVGVVATTEEYNIQNEVDNRDWSNSLVPFETPDMAGALTLSSSYDKYFNSDDQAIEGTVTRTDFETAQEVVLAAAKGDIIRAHRLTTVRFTVPFQPDVTLAHTVKIDTPYLVAAGKVKAIRDVWDVSTGEASTEISIAISRHNGSGVVNETDSLVALERPEPVDEEYIPYIVDLKTYIGGRETSAEYDEEAQTTWQGFLTNYLYSGLAPDWSVNPVINPLIAARTYPYSFVVRGPEINETHTTTSAATASQEYVVAIPEDTLTLVA